MESSGPNDVLAQSEWWSQTGQNMFVEMLVAFGGVMSPFYAHCFWLETNGEKNNLVDPVFLFLLCLPLVLPFLLLSIRFCFLIKSPLKHIEHSANGDMDS